MFKMPDTENYKRFMVFEISEYYPTGGLSDVVDSFDFINEVWRKYPADGLNAIQVFDRIEGVQVHRGQNVDADSALKH